MAITKASALFAVRNVAKFGDTDVYPFPLENHWFYDADEGVADLLIKLDSDFDQWLHDYPVHYSTELSRVGYNGFRAATQIDPIWNAYLLALLIEVGDDIERARLTVGSGGWPIQAFSWLEWGNSTAVDIAPRARACAPSTPIRSPRVLRVLSRSAESCSIPNPQDARISPAALGSGGCIGAFQRTCPT
jgi:hypothetical protein